MSRVHGAHVTCIVVRHCARATFVVHSFAQVPISTLEHTVMKLYLEDFHSFCLTLGPGTAEVSCRAVCDVSCVACESCRGLRVRVLQRCCVCCACVRSCHSSLAPVQTPSPSTSL